MKPAEKLQWAKHRWLVVCDDGAESYPSRRAARDAAAKIERHPVMADRRRFGPYTMGGATGTARVVDLGWPSQYRAAQGLAAYDAGAALRDLGFQEIES